MFYVLNLDLSFYKNIDIRANKFFKIKDLNYKPSKYATETEFLVIFHIPLYITITLSIIIHQNFKTHAQIKLMVV